MNPVRCMCQTCRTHDALRLRQIADEQARAGQKAADLFYDQYGRLIRHGNVYRLPIERTTGFGGTRP